MPSAPHAVRRSIIGPRRVTLPFALLFLIAAAASAQSYHPRVTAVSPQAPLLGETVTITGTDLKPGTWNVELRYLSKYGTGTHSLTLTGTSAGGLTFTAPTNMRPDGLQLIYSHSDPVKRETEMQPDERLQTVPSVFVREPPVLDAGNGTAVTSNTGVTFKVFPAGLITLRGRHLRNPPSGAPITITQARSRMPGQAGSGVTTTLPAAPALPPTLTFAGAALGVSSTAYIPAQRDEVVFAGNLQPHNASGFLKVTTTAGADSMRVTFVRAPENVRVFETVGTTLALVTSGQLVRNRTYQIRARHAVVIQTTGPNTASLNLPTVRIGGSPVNVHNTVFASTQLGDSIVQFSIPVGATSPTGGVLELSHAGGTAAGGTFTVVNPSAALTLSGAVVSPSEVVGGTAATMTVSFTQTPANFSTAGRLLVTVPAALSTAIPTPAPITITANPMSFSIPTNAVTAALSGTLSVRHETQGTASQNAAITVRPPRPTAVVVTPDTVPGGNAASGSVSFDLPGPATVFLSSSDPSVVSVPASVTRSGNAATFAITTQPVPTVRGVTITAALGGFTAAKTIVVRPGRLSSLTAAPQKAVAGEQVAVSVGFDVAVSQAPVTFTSSDTALKISIPTRNVTGTSLQFNLATTTSLATAVNATLTASSGGISRIVPVHIMPNQLTQFTVSPNNGPAGTTLAATVRLTRAAMQQHALVLESSDTTVATVLSLHTLLVGEETKVIPITLRGPQSSPRTATITARLHVANNVNSPVVTTRTVTVTARP